MTDHDAVIDAMSSVKGDVKERVDKAVAAILLLAWSYRREGFSFEDFPELNDQVNKILQSLSDGNLADAEKRAKALLESLGLGDWDDESLAYAEREIDGENALWRLDLHASHLKELLAGWIAVAATQKLSMTQMRLLMNTYGGMPWLSKKWRDSGLGKMGWGSGYQRDIVGAITVIGQNVINTAFLYSSVAEGILRGAVGYRTFRNSGYDCTLCDELTRHVWPIDVFVLPAHSRCVCDIELMYDGENVDHSLRRRYPDNILKKIGWRNKNATRKPSYSLEERKAIYARPFSEQFTEEYSKGNARVYTHLVKSMTSDDYGRVFDVAKAMAVRLNQPVYILPEVHASEVAFRNEIGLPTGSKVTPDIMIGIGSFVEVKSPKTYGKLVTNANKASGQMGVVCITDHSHPFDASKLDEYASRIFSDGHYNYDELYFFIKGKLYKKAKR